METLLLDSLLYAAVCLSVFILLMWLASIARRDASLVDRGWGLCFLILLAVAIGDRLTTGAVSWRAWMLLILVTCWALRLSVYITLRNWGCGEDKRYQAIRKNWDPGFWWKSLFVVFGLQGVLACLIASPFIPIVFGGTSSAFGFWDAFGLALWVFGFLFEAVADGQLYFFKRDLSNQGRVMDSGLWRLSRHPNYFGEAVLWWGYFALACAEPLGWTTIYAPALMTFLLMRVSGVVLLEKSMKASHPNYLSYIQSTPAFFPRIRVRRGA